MAQPPNLRPGISPPHSCHHCDNFIIYLYDEVGAARTDKPTWYTSNPSQVQLAEKLFGLDHAQSEDPNKVWEFYQRTNGISFFDTNLMELEAYAQDQCVLSQHILRCLMKDDFRPKVFAIGASIKTAYSLELGILDLDDLSWELLLGDEDDPCPDNTYSILACSDDPAAQIIDNRPINTEPGAVIALMQAKQWLHTCSTQHETCQQPSTDFTPTRLIQLTHGSPKITCRLVETQPRESKPYAVLSYCWGGDQVFKTTLATLPIYKKLIRSEDLPQGLQEAIFVADQLGFEYIWIDALCIIQDSAADQSIEIGQMAKVYGSATVTIAATRSTAVWNSFLGERKPLGAELPGMIFELPCRHVGRELGKLILIPVTFERTDPLDLRAWTFQERVLSPRVIDFGSLRMQWSCQMRGSYAGYSDGWSNLQMVRTYGSFDLNPQVISALIAGKYDVEDMLQFWMRITEGFTYRAITFSSDKLPAIAGMADRFEAVMPTKYCAGLWRTGMPVSLMWSAMRPEARPPRDKRCVPSWSWAAISGPVKLDRQHTDGDPSICFEVQVLDCRVELADKRSPYGAVKSGELTIRAYAQRVKWVQESIYGVADTLLAIDDGIPIHPEAFDLGFEIGDSVGINVVPDAVEQEFVDDQTSSIDAFLALCGNVVASESSGLSYALFGLVLRSEEGGRYSRVGMFRKTLARKDFKNYVHWFRKYGQETFVVV